MPDETNTPGNIEAKAYPLADLFADGNPLNILSGDIEGIVVLPKGYKAQHPALSSMESENAALRKKVDELTNSNASLSKELASEKTARTELSKKFEDIESGKKAELSESIANLRVEKGLLKTESKATFIKTLSALSPEQLTVQLEDTRSLSMKVDQPVPPVTPGDNNNAGSNEQEDRKRALRMELFGHADNKEA
jgi:hypothetical protein